MKKLILILFIIFGNIFSQVEQSHGKMPYTFYPTFYFDVATYKIENSNKSRVDVFVQVPYSSIQFIKTDDKYLAKYSVSVSFSFDGNIIIERTWNEDVVVDNFKETLSKLSNNYSYQNFELLPNEYEIRCQVTDRDSKKNYVYEGKVTVNDFSSSPNISSIVFISKKIQDKSGTSIIPNTSKIITNRDSVITFFYDITSDFARTLNVVYKIIDKKEKEVFQKEFEYNVDTGTNTIYESIPQKGLTIGEYQLYVILKDENSNTIVERKKNFLSQYYGIPTSITDIDKAIDQMVYIARQEEMDYIADGKTLEEKLERYLDYWKKKDPSPQTEENEMMIEYYRRVDYANDKFGRYIEGWRSDMGMIYILLGPPDNVERHPFETNSKPYEIWEYYDIRQQFVFVDDTGFGEYRLLNYNYGDWYRFRY